MMLLGVKTPISQFAKERKSTMDSCKLGFHDWAFTNEGKSRWCKKCQKKQERNDAGKWNESQATAAPVNKQEFCGCPQDYTISLKSMSCPRCGLPRRPRVLPTRPS